MATTEIPIRSANQATDGEFRETLVRPRHLQLVPPHLPTTSPEASETVGCLR